MPLTLRAAKGSPLTHAEMDANLQFLEDSGLSVGYHAIWLPAVALVPAAVDGASPALVSGMYQQLSVLEFDPATVQTVFGQIQLPESWDGSALYAKFTWCHAVTTTNFLVKWGISATALSDTGFWDIALGTYVDEVTTGGDDAKLYRSLLTAAITPAGTPGPDRTLLLAIRRGADDAVYDTLAVVARLLGVTVYYKVSDNVDVTV